MNKQIPWYSIDIRVEILASLKDYLVSKGYDSSVVDGLSSVSVRNLMDSFYLDALDVAGLDKEAAEFVSRKYYELRTRKYSCDSFLQSAAKEREIAYKGQWYSFLRNLLGRMAYKGDKVLFVGTADGNEIPADRFYRYYALEQLDGSINKLDEGKIVKKVIGDFEDDRIIIDGRNSMSVIVALRCLMPNTRLERFLQFVKVNLAYGGFVVLSHPMGCLLETGDLQRFDDAEERRLSFEDRLTQALATSGVFSVKKLEESAIEQFYELQYAKEESHA